MARTSRRDLIDESVMGVYHCVNRCVRRAFLCGKDPATGQDFEHRKEFIQRRLEFLAGEFGIDVLGFSVMSNHVHVVLRNRPDVVSAWSDDEVALRWWRLFPQRRDANGLPADPEPHELALLQSKAILKTIRTRLSSLSWFMRCLCEGVARLANREDQCTGRFWEGRFKCQALLDEAAILACSAYVDLNPVRAGVAATPETSKHTSAYERIAAMQGKPAEAEPAKPAAGKAKASTARGSHSRDAWLSPVELASETGKSQGAKPAPQRRASHLGFLPITLAEYLRLLDWTGRQIRRDKQGAIPADLAPILERLHVVGEGWVEHVKHFGRSFRRVVGRPETLLNHAASRGLNWLHGIARSREAFA